MYRKRAPRQDRPDADILNFFVHAAVNLEPKECERIKRRFSTLLELARESHPFTRRMMAEFAASLFETADREYGEPTNAIEALQDERRSRGSPYMRRAYVIKRGEMRKFLRLKDKDLHWCVALLDQLHALPARRLDMVLYDAAQRQIFWMFTGVGSIKPVSSVE